MDSIKDGECAANQHRGTYSRKRGHQHHNKFSGARHSNVRAEEIIAALHSGEQLQINQHNVPPRFDQVTISEQATTRSIRADDSDNSNLSVVHSSIVERIASKPNRLSDDKRGDKSTISDTLSNDRNVIVKTSSSGVDDSTTVQQRMLQQSASGDICWDTKMKDDADDSISSGSSSSNKYNAKAKRSKRLAAGKEGNGTAPAGKRSSHHRKAFPSGERPPLEGADAANWHEITDNADIENDPEAAEWSKLRCTSERMEVVAEREYRRQNRRCADYPGLAFGRSIFSSDTMMKLQLIRNELHNIMKSQLKRVCVNRNDFYKCCSNLRVRMQSINSCRRRQLNG